MITLDCTQEEFDDAMHYIAQGIINIDSEITTIAQGSKVYHAMVTLCKIANKTPESA